jgi:hypothetical protein
MWFLSLFLFICHIMFMDLYMLTHSCITGMKPSWSWCMNFLMCFWILSASILLRSLHLYLLKILVYNSLFWLCLCLVL